MYNHPFLREVGNHLPEVYPKYPSLLPALTALIDAIDHQLTKKSPGAIDFSSGSVYPGNYVGFAMEGKKGLVGVYRDGGFENNAPSQTNNLPSLVIWEKPTDHKLLVVGWDPAGLYNRAGRPMIESLAADKLILDPIQAATFFVLTGDNSRLASFMEN